MFKFDPEKQYMMPAHFGPRVGKGSAKYLDTTTMMVSYLTDKDMLAKYLPEPFEVGPEPIISVSHTVNREIEWLAGGSYNIVGVNAAAIYNGKVDHVEGTFCLVLWENLTDPILTGRELQGIPKIFADITDHVIFRDEWRGTASYRGHKIMDMILKDLKPVPQERMDAMAQAQQRAGDDGVERGWMGWKYIPNTGKPGAEVSYATLFPTSGGMKEAWTATGEVQWNHLTWEQNPTQHHIVNALADLPIIEYRMAMVFKGTSDLAVAQKPVRPLR